MSDHDHDAPRPSIDAELVNAIKRTPVVLVLDTSSSMAEKDRIRILNETLSEFLEAVGKNDELSDALLLCVVTFGGEPRIVVPWTSIDQVQLPQLVASGATPMGDAVTLAIGEIDLLRAELQAAGTPYHVPWMVLMSDGEPTDHWEEASRLVQERIAATRLVSFAFGIPPASHQVLRRFGAPSAPNYSVREQDIRKLFVDWLTGSLVKVAESSPGQGVQVTAPPLLNIPS